MPPSARSLPSLQLVPLVIATAAALPAQQGIVLGPDLLSPVGPAGDVDGDGIADYVLGGTGVTVHSGATGTAIPFLASATALACRPVGDVDADGKDDLAYLTAADVAIVSGGDGSVLHTWTIANAEVTGSADLDADGCSDVLLAYTVAGEHWIEVRSGRTGLVLHDRSGANELTPMAIGDRDGDGYDDLAILAADVAGTSWTAEVRLGPTFELSTTLVGNPGLLGDVDDDGATDHTRRVSTSPPSTEVVSGATGAVLMTYPWDPQFRALGDVDGDGHDDFRLRQGAFTEIMSGATLTLMLPSINLSQLGLDAQWLGDIDGDGRNEASVPGSGQVLEWADAARPVVSRLVRRGGSGATSLGHRPKLHVRGHCKLGATIHWDLRGSLPNGLSVLLVGAAVDIDIAFLGAPGNRLYCDLAGLMPVLNDAHGLGQWQSPIPVDPSLIGSTISAQGAVWDPAANAFGFVGSNAIDVFIED